MQRTEERPTVHRYSDADDRGTSWTSVVLGWLAALGAGLILSGIVGGIVGAILGADGSAQTSRSRAYSLCSYRSSGGLSAAAGVQVPAVGAHRVEVA